MTKISEIIPRQCARTCPTHSSYGGLIGVLLRCLTACVSLDYRLLELAAANAINQGALFCDIIERSIFVDALGILLFVIAAGSCAAYFLIGHYTKPVQQLSAHMKEVAQIHCLTRGGGERRFKKLD